MPAPGGRFHRGRSKRIDGFSRKISAVMAQYVGRVYIPIFLTTFFDDAHFSKSRRLYELPSGGDASKDYELGFVAFKDPEQGGF